MEENKTINGMLNEREKIYGNIKHNSEVAVNLSKIYRNRELPCYVENNLYQICLKIARIVSGDVNHLDNYLDILGYAHLMIDTFKKEKESVDFKPSFERVFDYYDVSPINLNHYDKILENYGASFFKLSEDQRFYLNLIVICLKDLFLPTRKIEEIDFLNSMDKIIKLSEKLIEIVEGKKQKTLDKIS